MKYYVLNGAKKYDNVQNEGKGWYRNWAVVLELTDGKKYVGYHSETYYWEGSGWEDNHHGPTYWSELPKDFYEKYHQVGGEECSEACEALWYKFKEDNEEKAEMEKATNSKIEFLKSLETDNVNSSVTKEVINDMKKQYENTPTTSLKEVMGWLIEDKEVVYRFIHPGEVDEWLKVDPKHPILSEQYEYQLAEKIQETWNFRIPEYSIKASCREEARKKAFERIMEYPDLVVVYPGVRNAKRKDKNAVGPKILARVIKNYFNIPYQRTLLVTLDSGKQLYCERRAFVDFRANKQWTKDWKDLKGRGGKYRIYEGIWNLFPDDDIGYVPLKKIKDFKYLKDEEDFKQYKAYRLRYYEEHPVEMYMPEERDGDTKKFLRWINQPNVQEMIRNWVSGYGYSDAYNWESPDILMEHIWKAGLKEGRDGRI